jgi:ATP-binding cassette subfamily F protein 3
MLAGFQNVTFEFGARVIVQDATWHIHPQDRIGLVGYNGTGKSTLLKVIVGEFLPSNGTVERGRNTTIGYLHQDLLSFDTEESILQVAMHAFDRAMAVGKELDALTKRLETEETEALLHEYSDMLHQFEEAGGYEIEHKTSEVLQGLGFSNMDLQRPYKEFSGGWRMRVLLARMILQEPDLLLLDEPTNHLDLPSIEWLEKYLQHYKGAVVMVSHDRYFLNRMVKKIVELYQRELHFYTGNYEYYETEKELRIEQQQRAFENQQDYIRQNERLVERFRAKASKAAMAQSIMKKLERLDRIEDVGIERPDLRINFAIDKVPGKVLCELKHVTKKFPSLTIVENASAEIERGDKIALIGANGKGKSTLLRIIAGTEPVLGERKWGHNVDEAFYAQHQLEALNLNNTLLDELKDAGSQKTEQELRNLLGCFLFGGDDIDKKIKVLSGGEKARVALAKTIISKANFLLLDEPTNHLDIHSTELLVESLNRYEGTFVLVSHDRYFISKTANKIWEIVDHRIREFKGTYDEWVDWKARREKEQKEEQKNKEQGTGEQQKSVRKEEPKKVEAPVVNEKRAINKDLQKDLQKLQRQFGQVEHDLAKCNDKKQTIEASLGAPETYANPDLFKKTEAEYAAIQKQITTLNQQYEVLFEQIMELEARM